MWDSPSFWGVFSYPVNFRVARRRLATTRGKMPKGILLVARTIHQEIRKDIFSMWDSPSFGESFLIPWNCGVARRRLATTRGKMPKGILLVARTIHQEIRKDIFSIWDSPGFGESFLILWNCGVARSRLATTRGKMPKGILLIARTVPIPIPTLLFI